MSDKRIIEYDAATTARTDDNILMDSPAVGTRKITKANFLADVYTAFQTIGNSITDINTFIGNETLQTEADTITGAINEILNNAATAIELTQAEYDALVLADEDKENVPYYISDAQSPAQIGLWAKVGSDELNVGDDLSDAVNELDNSVRTIKSNLTEYVTPIDITSQLHPNTGAMTVTAKLAFRMGNLVMMTGQITPKMDISASGQLISGFPKAQVGGEFTFWDASSGSSVGFYFVSSGMLSSRKNLTNGHVYLMQGCYITDDPMPS